MHLVPRLAVLSAVAAAKHESKALQSIARRAFASPCDRSWNRTSRGSNNTHPPISAFSVQRTIARTFTSKSTLPQDDKVKSPTDRAPSSAEHLSTAPPPSEQKSWEVPEGVRKFVNDLLFETSKLSLAYHKYMGTDRSNIENIGQRIVIQEQTVLDCYQAVQDARKGQADAILEQSNAQKEIVRLLERKSSWSPEDLERYMSLVRSEHLNDQAVVSAKEKVHRTEGELEAARTLVGKMRATRDHEEKIWGYTTLGNGTFVTIALMGVNIGLLLLSLLVQVAIFEPRRMRKTERAVKAAIEQEKLLQLSPEVVKQVDEAVVPSASLETLELPAIETAKVVDIQEQTLDASPPDDVLAGAAPLAVEELPALDSVNTAEQMAPLAPSTFSSAFALRDWSEMLKICRETIRDIFSERVIELKKVELTVLLLQGTITSLGVLYLLLVRI
ncbi:hypothetical protein K431DRAFT_282494, partial [Polychaeton citri CBS 116435]